MSENQPITEDLKKALSLKWPEPAISPEQPWSDDAMERAKVGVALTNLIRNQSGPLAISLNGQWGTGKTFLLKRWQEALKSGNFACIYFNAWEDDFCDDPFVALIGQLSDSFEKDPYKEIVGTIKKAAKFLLVKNIQGVLKFTGFTIPDDLPEQLADKTLKAYSEQRKNKEALKTSLQELSAKVKETTKSPLVFIIDELDRCRPTFAVELLERVKHVFDIDNMVFVFGVNRDELCSSIKSIYGEIDADVYLRRFFDMEFQLPEANSETFAGT